MPFFPVSLSDLIHAASGRAVGASLPDGAAAAGREPGRRFGEDDGPTRRQDDGSRTLDASRKGGTIHRRLVSPSSCGRAASGAGLEQLAQEGARGDGDRGAMGKGVCIRVGMDFHAY